MKKLLLSLVLLSSQFLYAHEPSTAPTPLTPEETRFLGTLYWNKKNAASFAQGLTAADLTYAIYVISKNIPILQNHMLPENSKKGQYALMCLGGLTTILYGGISSFVTHKVYKRNYEFISGRFENAFILKSKIDDLSSIRFSLKEKKYLRQFKAENIIIEERSYWVSSWEKEQTEEIMSQMSRRNKEKVTYYALREAVNFHKNRFLRDAFMPAFLITATIGVFAATLYGVIYHKELLKNQLEDCQNIYRILKNEQDRRMLS